MLGDVVQKHEGQAGLDTSSEIARKEIGGVVLLERLMEEMSR